MARGGPGGGDQELPYPLGAVSRAQDISFLRCIMSTSDVTLSARFVSERKLDRGGFVNMWERGGVCNDLLKIFQKSYVNGVDGLPDARMLIPRDKMNC